MALRLFNWIMAAVMLSPILLIIWMSFTPGAMFRIPLEAFSLRWYREVFAYPGFVNAFFLSLRLAAAAAGAAVALSFVAAYALARTRLRGRAALDALFTAPLIVPAVVFGIAMLQFSNRLGLYNTFFALVVAHVAIVTPYAMRSIAAALRAVPIEMEWAAMNLGARRGTVLLRIVLPLCARGMVAAFLLCFLMSFSEVTVTIFMTGPGYQTLPVRIYNYLTDQVDPTVAALSAMLIGLSLLLALIVAGLGGFKEISK
ncbi:MAG TPA: ABC transporter permease [Stellaceae bacterium]|nr:ABC transporter permease [Stellaceae bacterium]